MNVSLAPRIIKNWNKPFSDTIKELLLSDSDDRAIFEAASNLYEGILLPSRQDMNRFLRGRSSATEAQKEDFRTTGFYEMTTNDSQRKPDITPEHLFALYLWGGEYLRNELTFKNEFTFEMENGNASRKNGTRMSLNPDADMYSPDFRAGEPIDMAHIAIVSKDWDIYKLALGSHLQTAGEWAYAVVNEFRFPEAGDGHPSAKTLYTKNHREFFSTVYPAFKSNCARYEAVAWSLAFAGYFKQMRKGLYRTEREFLAAFTTLSSDFSIRQVRPYIDYGISEVKVIRNAIVNNIDASLISNASNGSV